MQCKAIISRDNLLLPIRCLKEAGHNGWHDSRSSAWHDRAEGCIPHEEALLAEYGEWVQYREGLKGPEQR